MTIKSGTFWWAGLLGAALSLAPVYTVADAPFLRYLQDNDTWRTGSGVTATEGELRLESGDEEQVIVSTGEDPENLLTRVQFSDAVVTLEYLPGKDTRAGLFLQGRYGIALTGDGSGKPGIDSAGAVQQRRDGGAGELVGGNPPLAGGGVTSSQWQTLEVRFRAPRYDEASQKVENALIIEAHLNGELVQRNTVLRGFTRGALSPWETTRGPMMLAVESGVLAVRRFDARPADFGALAVPEETGGQTNEDGLEDFVALGEMTFQSLGCQECHTVERDDQSMKTGPDLYGLFRQSPRDREVEEPESGHHYSIQADAAYLRRSVREPDAELAVAESGPNAGRPYSPLMPSYSQQSLPDKELDAIGAYLQTLNPLRHQGAVVRLVSAEGPEQYDPMVDDLQFLVDQRVRLQRGPIEGLSARAIHVGQPNGVNYSFDPRLLGIARLWQGGFLDMSGELENRGGGGLKTGYEAREIDLGEAGILFAPLNAGGELIDFSFKEAVFGDTETVRASLWSEQDHLARLAREDARFLGYRRSSRSKTGPPGFRYQVGENRIEVSTAIDAEGVVTIRVSGERVRPQRFLLGDPLEDAEVSAGTLADGVWTLPAGDDGARLHARLQLASRVWRPEPSDFEHGRQPLETTAAKAELPAGYRLENYLSPRDNYGREQLFEPLGMAVAKDGTIVVATRTAGIWRIKDGQWHLFAEGLFDSLGVQIEDEQGLQLVVGQKPELTRITDTDGDGRADRFDTLFDAHSLHGNYHTYMHGPARGAGGDYYIGLNLAHADEAVHKAGGQFMGSQGGLSGWAVRVSPEGEFEPFASGLRSPAGIARGPDGRIWYTENQGEFVGTSKLFLLARDRFYGHPSGLVDLPGMKPDSPQIGWDKVADERERAVVLFPHNQVANSPGHPVWDTTEGRFGPFAGQMFVGDQTQSNLLRVTTEQLGDGTEQGAVMPFARGLASGAIRPAFLPDGSLLVGQSGRGWQARGGHVASMQRLIWDGETVPFELSRVVATPHGFEVRFTRPLPGAPDGQTLREALEIHSWTYRDAPEYGSEMLDKRAEPVAEVRLSRDRQSLRVALESTESRRVHPQQTGRVYHLVLAGQTLDPGSADGRLEAFYTLHRFPGNR